VEGVREFDEEAWICPLVLEKIYIASISGAETSRVTLNFSKATKTKTL